MRTPPLPWSEESPAVATATVLHEHHALLAQYGRVQARCSAQLGAQARQIERLQAEALRLRAALVARETALAWTREDLRALEAAVPGLPRRQALARQVEALVQRVQQLMRERLGRPWRAAANAQVGRAAGGSPGGASVLCLARDASGALLAQCVVGDAAPDHPERLAPGEAEARLEASLVAADLVICQTGCLSHGAYWRVQDHCRRTGKPCVLVDQPPQALRFMPGARQPSPACAAEGT